MDIEAYKPFLKPTLFVLTGVILLGIAGFFIYQSGILTPAHIEVVDAGAPLTATPQVLSKTITVEVAGAVKLPGVYEFEGTGRVQDALTKAGGLSGNADADYVEKAINRAAKLVDGQKIYIPTVGEAPSVTVPVLGSQTNQNGIISINGASQTELESLAGVGPATAKKIIAGRPFSDISELVEKKIITQKVFDQIKTQLGL